MTKFYDCEKIWNTLDADGEPPAVTIVCSRVRGPGKTYSFSKKFLDLIFESNFQKKVGVLCRTQSEVGSLAEGMFKSMMYDHYPAWEVYEKKRMSGAFSEIYIKALKPGYAEEGEEEEYEIHQIGYVIPINSAQRLKNKSAIFVDVEWLYFDEFMPELQSGYLPEEIEKFHLLFGNIAKGKGKSVRPVPIYMTSNTVTLNNPYFEALGLYKYIQPDTKFYRGRRVVYEIVKNDELAKEHSNSAFNIAFSSNNRLIDYEGEQWYNSDNANVTKPQDWGRSKYLGTIIAQSKSYGVYYYPEMGFIYVQHTHDKTSKALYRLNVDVNKDVQVVKSSILGRTITQALSDGRCYFSTAEVRRMVLQITGRL